jgi:hypothetical protein
LLQACEAVVRVYDARNSTPGWYQAYDLAVEAIGYATEAAEEAANRNHAANAKTDFALKTLEKRLTTYAFIFHYRKN